MQKKLLSVMSRLLLLGGVIIFCSCVRDDRDDCLFPLRLKFSYNYNREQQDLFVAEVERVRLYLFDSRNGRLAASTIAHTAQLGPDNVFTWNVAPGAYHVVAWGGPERRYPAFPDNGLRQSRLSVAYREDKCVEQSSEHLWHQTGHDLSVTGDQQALYTLDLHKFSNDVRVEVKGLPTGALHRLACTISATNGHYDFDGNTHSDAESIVWLPESRQENGFAVHDFTVLRLWPGDDSRLHVELMPGEDGSRSVSGVIYDGSLSQLLLENPDVDLDLDDEFTVRLEAQVGSDGNISVSVYVNDWFVIDMNGGLG